MSKARLGKLRRDNAALWDLRGLTQHCWASSSPILRFRALLRMRKWLRVYCALALLCTICSARQKRACAVSCAEPQTDSQAGP